jgi:uncharacterized protein (TIGR02246 family)
MAATPMISTTDIAPSTEEIARRVLTRLESAWNDGDGPAFGSAYAEDAAFVTIRGEHLDGRAGITAGHAGIFATIYAGSTNRMDLIAARPITPDVIVMNSTGTLTAPHGPLQGTHTAMSTSVLVRADDDWLIAATHNTLIQRS